MKAFISYSHVNSDILTLLHKHLAQLQRDNIISTWTDRDIMVGSKFDQTISSALNSADLFIALLSPDYIASNYCYEKEFQKALEMQEQGMIIIPIIIEPCDWLNTPFKDFKALPTDGKAVSTWENKNTAFLDVVQNIRRLVATASKDEDDIQQPSRPIQISRNYRVQKDFDSIEKMEFVEKTLHDIKEYLKRYIEEIVQIDNIKARILVDNNKVFECLLVNRNKIATESHLRISIDAETLSMSPFRSNERQLTYSINTGNNSRESTKVLTLAFDEYHLFWTEKSYYSGSQNKKELISKDISDIIWSEWLQSVGIL